MRGLSAELIAAVVRRVLAAVGTIVTVTGNVNGSVNSVTTAVTVGTNSDKTGYSLTAGSYSIRAASTQQLTGTITSTNTAGAASVSFRSHTRCTSSYNCKSGVYKL